LSPKGELDKKVDRLVLINGEISQASSHELSLDSFIVLVSGMGSIRPFEWLMLLSWLLTVSVILVDSWLARQRDAKDLSEHGDDVGNEQWWNQLVKEHVWLVRLFAYYWAVIIFYPFTKLVQQHGALACLEPLAVTFRAILSLCRPQVGAPDLATTRDAAFEMQGSLLGSLEPEPEPELEDVDSDDASDDSSIVGGQE